MNTTLLDNLSTAIDTMYDAARGELFRSLEQYTRHEKMEDEEYWAAVIASPEAAGRSSAGSGKVTYDNRPAHPHELAAWGAANPARGVYLQRLRDTCQALTLTCDEDLEDFVGLAATVMRLEAKAKGGIPIERFFLRVEIEWGGDTLVRDYAL